MNNTVAYVFPGQGAQTIGMLDDAINIDPLTSSLLQEASEAVGYNVNDLINHGPSEKLNQTQYTQVAMLVTDVVFYKLIQKFHEFTPEIMAGHSLGEYAALVCAGALNFQDAVSLVNTRGKIMQETLPLGKGAMAAIVGLDNDVVEAICIDNSNETHQVVPANYNTIGQTVIAGHSLAVESAVHHAERVGAKLAKIIPVSVPCHCPLLEPAAKIFREALNKTAFHVPQYKVLSNIDAQAYISEQDIRERLARQLYNPVQWVKTIQVMISIGTQTVIECGPGKTLTGLIKRLDKTLTLIPANKLIGN